MHGDVGVGVDGCGRVPILFPHGDAQWSKRKLPATMLGDWSPDYKGLHIVNMAEAGKSMWFKATPTARASLASVRIVQRHPLSSLPPVVVVLSPLAAVAIGAHLSEQPEGKPEGTSACC